MNRTKNQSDKRHRKQPGLLIDVNLYRKFKAVAALQGIGVGQAMDQAMADFVKRQGAKL